MLNLDHVHAWVLPNIRAFMEITQLHKNNLLYFVEGAMESDSLYSPTSLDLFTF